MFKVECPGCKAPYQVDERRVPKSGLKMRCPKCGTSFNVESPESGSEAPPPVLGGFSPNAAQQRSRAAAAGLKSTMLGVAAPAGMLDEPQKRPPPPRLSRSGHGGPAGVSPKPRLPPPRMAPTRPQLAPSQEQPPAGRPPAPSARGQLASDPYAEADLPMLGGGGARESSSAPAQRSRGEADRSAASLPLADDDLPALPQRRAREPADSLELDLPAVPQARAMSPAGGFDLDADLPAPRTAAVHAPGDDRNVDLPEPRSRGATATTGPVASRRGHQSYEGLDVDLPVISHPSGREAAAAHDQSLELDLPVPSAELPSPSKGAGVPLLSLDSVLPGSADDLPSPGGAALPSPAGQLPSAARSGARDLPEHAAALPSPAESLPTAAGELPMASQAYPALQQDAAEQSFETFSIPPDDGGFELDGLQRDSGDFGELELPLGSDPFAAPEAGSNSVDASPGDIRGFASNSVPAAPASRHSQPPQIERQAGGGVSFGEVNLMGDDDQPAAEVALDDVRSPQASMSDEDMEFGAIPQEDGPEVAAPTAGASQVRMDIGALPAERPKRSGAVKIALGVVVLLSVGGGALALVPDVGPFGYYAISDVINRAEYERLTEAAVADSRQLLSKDTFRAARNAVERVEAARMSAPRQRPLSAYSAFVAFAREMRFGENPEIHARAEVTLDSLKEYGDVQYRALAEAGREAVDGEPKRARRALKAVLARDESKVDAWIVLGELELRAEDAKAAREAWQRARKLENSARTSFGLARARLLAGDIDAAEKLARETLAKQPEHAGATLLVAEATWKRDESDKTADLIKGIIQQKQGALSPEEEVIAHTLLGSIYLSRSRIGLAEKAFGEALKLNPKSSVALRGLGQALYKAARYSEALARYEAAAQAEPHDLEAKLGVVKSKLVLERIKEAALLAEGLRKTHPQSAAAALWHGQALEALGQREQAETAYRVAVELSGKDVSAVRPYVALAMLLNQLGKADEAQQFLDRARSELPKAPEIHKALGDVALAQGRYQDALSEYEEALELNPEDLTAQFQRGVTLRRSNQLEEATEAFERVAKTDPEYPGLALERGLLHEAAGRSAEALKAYEAALSKAPNDPDLMLRVGCSNVSAGRVEQAEQLLRKVLQQRPNSAETNHCLGRAMLLDPSRLAEALRTLERAVSIDPNRPEYHMYVGWAANEARNFKKAQSALERALALDQSLADAYWQRGVLLARQGVVKDAIVDLNKALTLRPSRHEAHAALADAYYDLGREPQALQEWQRAISAMPEQAAWRFRYGKLLSANRRQAEAREQLSAALELTKDEQPKPYWTAEAHLLLAQILGEQAAAVEHWRAYLEYGPKTSPYRAEAKRALRKLGKPWRDN